MAHLRNGDVLVVWKLDRLGRSLTHLVQLVNQLLEQGVRLQRLNDSIDTTNAREQGLIWERTRG